MTAPPHASRADRHPVPVHAPVARAAACGVLAGAAALVAGELVGRLVRGASSPVVAVGDTVIALAPAGFRDAAIGAFGTLDKPLLLGGVVLVCGLVAAAAGLLHRASPAAAAGLVATVAVAAGAAVAADTGGSALGGIAVGGTVLALGVVLLRTLLPPRSQATPDGQRREFLRRAAAVGLLVVAGGSVVSLLDGRGRITAMARAALRLPPATTRATGDLAAAELGLPGLTRVVTPNSAFYRIDTALVVPQVDPAGWTLTVDGMVDRELRLTLEDLLALPQVEADITLQCVSNEVGGDLVGMARWQGVRLRDVLEAAGVRRGAEQVVGTSVDGFTAGFPSSYAMDGRASMIALGMNGELLPVLHGFPARLVVPGLYGYVSATKWLERITLTTWAGFDGFWVPRGWSKEGPIKPASRIDVPADTATVATGQVTVAGMAWAPDRGITSVEVQVDRAGRWLPAELGPSLSDDAWRQWHLDWDAAPGVHLLQVRCTDGSGRRQDPAPAPPRPDGATGLHAVRVRVV